MHNTEIANPVTYLFVPADRPERFAKAVSSGADVAIIDLEDAVASDKRADARENISRSWEGISRLAAQQGTTLCIRINSMSSTSFENDLTLCRRLKPTLIMAAKVESRFELSGIADGIPSAGLLPLIESATGVLAVNEIASAPNVSRLVFGSVDLMLDLGVSHDREPLDMVRSMLVLASARARLPGPIDGVCVSIDDVARINAEAARAREFGFTGKLCIHPRQVATVAEAFLVSDEELSWANRVIAAVEESKGAATKVDGMMIDAPVLLRAQRLASHARRTRTRD